MLAFHVRSHQEREESHRRSHSFLIILNLNDDSVFTGRTGALLPLPLALSHESGLGRIRMSPFIGTSKPQRSSEGWPGAKARDAVLAAHLPIGTSVSALTVPVLCLVPSLLEP